MAHTYTRNHILCMRPRHKLTPPLRGQVRNPPVVQRVTIETPSVVEEPIEESISEKPIIEEPVVDVDDVDIEDVDTFIASFGQPEKESIPEPEAEKAPVEEAPIEESLVAEPVVEKTPEPVVEKTPEPETTTVFWNPRMNKKELLAVAVTYGLTLIEENTRKEIIAAIQEKESGL